MNKLSEMEVELYTNYKKDLEKQIILAKFEIRWHQRAKITARSGQLGEIENSISIFKAQIRTYESKIELIDDIIKESSTSSEVEKLKI